MHKNKLWLFLLVMVGLSALWYTGIAGYRYYMYSRLDTQTHPASMSWKIAAHSADNYTLVADYQFAADGTTFSGSMDFLDDIFLNELAAEKGIESNKKLPWKVWYYSENPNHSSLQKDFPFKQYIYALILWGIWLYFLWLGFYVTKFKV